jgi:ribulose 1,5-bisphosphate carboxylase large subunit-like protein
MKRAPSASVAPIHSKFEDRLAAVLDALARAKKKTGKGVIYFVSIVYHMSA